MAFDINASFDSFIKRAHNKFNKHYYYDRQSFTKMKIKMDIYCPVHGKFTQVPSKHLTGKGCPRCIEERVANEQRTSNSKFIEKAIAVHGTKYDYSKVVYQTAKLPVTIICPEHGPFTQTPVKHTSQGCGCSQCAHYGINYDLPAVLYYLAYTNPMNKQILYKIGITNKSVKERFFNTELAHMDILFELSFATAKEAYQIEQKIINRYKEYQYKGPKLLHRGSTEFFTKDILVTIKNNASLDVIKQQLSTLKD